MLTGPLVDFLQKLPGSLKQTRMWSQTLYSHNRKGQRGRKWNWALNSIHPQRKCYLKLRRIFDNVMAWWDVSKTAFQKLLYSMKGERSLARNVWTVICAAIHNDGFNTSNFSVISPITCVNHSYLGESLGTFWKPWQKEIQWMVALKWTTWHM